MLSNWQTFLGGYIAQCYVPNKKTMELRELVRHRAALVRMRTKLKNKIHGILLMKGITIPGIYPFTRAYVDRLRELDDYRINGYLTVIESLDVEIKDVSRKILQFAKEDEMARLLMTIPRIGYYSALLIVSEIGDINRFPNSHHLCAYAGLVPSTHSSGGVTYNGRRITKTGSRYLRWIIIECAQAHIRTVRERQRQHIEIPCKAGKKEGKCSGNSCRCIKTAAHIVYWVMKERREYHS